ncbi:glutaminase A [Desulfofalx alkaliphila]|uniref:glutaminase A n=1 Tax=Desulfofalx alkaliphila TaxID=105483 RepID=UPI0004E23FD4|nr:glutaminase A [Desulfofalx alkaliphila]
MKELLEKILEENRHWTKKGKVATYIPALAKADPKILGITVIDIDGKAVTVGDCDTKFTLQSISKPLALMLALMDKGTDEVFSKVGMEPTGDPFNSIIKLETLRTGKPLNPMINAGAIATTALIEGQSGGEKIERLLEFVRLLAGNKDIRVNEEVYRSEQETGDRNRAMAYFMKDLGVLEADVDQILEVYFRQCAIEVTCSDIAHMARCLANKGNIAGKQIIPHEIVRLTNTFMVTCGMYNASGEFAIKVGIPAKSGVSGGIMALVPGKMGIGIIGPALNKIGNSIAGVHMLEDLSRALDLSIF